MTGKAPLILAFPSKGPAFTRKASLHATASLAVMLGYKAGQGTVIGTAPAAKPS